MEVFIKEEFPPARGGATVKYVYFAKEFKLRVGSDYYRKGVMYFIDDGKYNVYEIKEERGLFNIETDYTPTSKECVKILKFIFSRVFKK